MPPNIIVLEYEDGRWKHLFFWPHQGDTFAQDELHQIQWHLDHEKCHRVPEDRAIALYNLWRPSALESLKKTYKGSPPRNVTPPSIEEPEGEWNWNKAAMRAVI